MPKQRRILIVKLASMGDLVHLLPALTDAKKADPTLVFDWVVDKHFAEVASWHTSIQNTILTSHRAWRSSPFHKKTRSEFSSFLTELKKNSYDLVIDAQGNIKTALLGLFIKGKKSGFDASSIREWGAHLLYDKKIHSSKKLHAIARLRELFAKSLDYPLPNTPPDYQINKLKLIPPPIPLPPSYLVFVPIASYSSKLWPEEYWEALIEKAKILGHFILIPWGNEKERQRALRLSNHSHVTILPKLSLSEISYLILHSKAVVSMDTGFSHIAAALNIPAITLYGPTDPALTGTVGENQVHLCSPCPCLGKKTCAQAQKPMCLCKITPSYVFFELQKLLNTL